MDTSNKITFSKEAFLLGEEQIRPQDIPHDLWRKIIVHGLGKLQPVMNYLGYIEISDPVPLRHQSLWGTDFYLSSSPGREPVNVPAYPKNLRLLPLCALGKREMSSPPRDEWVNEEGIEDYLLYNTQFNFIRLRRIFDHKGPQGERGISVKGYTYKTMTKEEEARVFKDHLDCCKILASLSHLTKAAIEYKRWNLKNLESRYTRLLDVQRRIEGFEG